jgi:hypothetical protein
MDGSLQEDEWKVYYSPQKRYYAIGLVGSEAFQTIHFCPWCGGKLPTDLTDTWFDLLKKEHGIEFPFCEDRGRVPVEFRSDEWWKKRGY